MLANIAQLKTRLYGMACLVKYVLSLNYHPKNKFKKTKKLTNQFTGARQEEGKEDRMELLASNEGYTVTWPHSIAWPSRCSQRDIGQGEKM